MPRVLILGAGGAARAVLGGLYQLPGVREILLCARREEQARELAARVRPLEDEHRPRTAPLPEVHVLPWDIRHEAGADLIVNTTPAGLEGTSPLTGFPRSGTGLAYDLVYFRTPFLDAAEAAGWKTLNGRDMFANQGGAQFTLWTGFPLPGCGFPRHGRSHCPPCSPVVSETHVHRPFGRTCRDGAERHLLSESTSFPV